MRRHLSGLAVGFAVSVCAGPARGQDVPDGPADDVHVSYSADDRWARGLLVGLGGLFAAAAVVGPIVRWRSRDLVPAAATHEEDPAADRH